MSTREVRSSMLEFAYGDDPLYPAVSSNLNYYLTLYRNQDGYANKVVAQFGYGLITLIAAVESVAAGIFFVLTLPLIMFSHVPSVRALSWCAESAVACSIAIQNFVKNFFAERLESSRF